jgi:hypothetical protein
MSKQGDRIIDPAAYEARAKPRPRAEVEASIKAFGTELRELCAKHGIADCVYAVAANVEGQPRTEATVGFIGDASRALELAATMYVARQVAHVKAAREEVADMDRQVRAMVAREIGEEDDE